MYLHLGQDTVVRLDEIVGIFDMDTSTISKHTRQFLADAEKGGRIFNVSMELPKSFVVCLDTDGTETVYISQISSTTLCKRTGFMDGIANIRERAFAKGTTKKRAQKRRRRGTSNEYRRRIAGAGAGKQHGKGGEQAL